MTSKFNLENKVAIVTGGSRGIGKAISLGLAEAGADVVPVSRTKAAVDEVCNLIENLGRRTLSITTDVSDESSVKFMIEKVIKTFDKIDILINGAGISPILKSAEKTSLEEWNQIINTNLTGVFICSNEVGKIMIDKNVSGTIINIASVGGKVGLLRQAAYCAAKGGVIQLTKVLALDWVKYGIRVNAIAPGYVKTDLTAGVMNSEKIYNDLISKTPMSRFGEPEEITGTAIYLASDEASYVTGEVITVDGGYTVW
ncbi:SDR family NAD(P)-dependent oxidoreductase [Tepidanaerobacter syntrophicus]|uniref:SDR family NAD(P)-dependent oxidoreductase n=1 Tax=Tepidanaerobacter syntrophicus TaxID=224999 RepID=UPI001BD2DC0E|nr:SDR family oxidoreductase [Tepidanaerobacter syntrophicus]